MLTSIVCLLVQRWTSASQAVHSFVSDLDVLKVLQHSKVASIVSDVQHKVSRQVERASKQASTAA